MAILNTSRIPTIERLAEEGCELVDTAGCESRQLQVLKVGLLNMMPDKAVAATERQFLRLLASSDRHAIDFYPFTISGISRSVETEDYFSEYYSTVGQVQQLGLDALVVTGANITQASLTQEPFWNGLRAILQWANEASLSTLCSCLATHAAFKVFYDVDRRHLGAKCWGLFSHDVPIAAAEHAIVAGLSSKIDMPHSRFNDVSVQMMERNDVLVTLSSEQVGVQMAIESDLRRVYFQGHPEYDAISLPKEYKREVIRFARGEREEYPPYPANCFSTEAIRVGDRFKREMLSTQDRMKSLGLFPEDILSEGLVAEWRRTAALLFRNWLGMLHK